MYEQCCRLYGRLDTALQSRRSWDVTARTLLAIVGSYALTALLTASLSLAFPYPKAQAVLLASLLSFAFYACLAIWAFCARTALRAWGLSLCLAVPPALHLLIEGMSA